MPEVQTVDEVVNTRAPSRGLSARPVHEENVSAATGAAKAVRSDVEDETHSGHVRGGRKFKESTEKMLKKFEKEEPNARAPAPHEEGDADESETSEEDADGAGDADGEAGDDAGADDGESADAGGDEEAAEGTGDEEGESESEGEETPDPTAEWQTANARLEARNRELLGELETARKTPKTQRTERETALMAAEAAYVDEGSVPALRKFLGVIIGAAPDSKEVDAELAGVYTDLTARELGVPLDENQKALRDNARTRLLLARDRREKADAGKKTEPDNSAGEVNYENASKHAENLLVVKGQGGTSIADEHPLLMSLAEDFDGFKAPEVIARAIRQELETGTLDVNTSDIDMIRIVASKIEKHYDAVAKRIEAARAKQKKPGTTTPSAKPKAATEPSKEQRQSTGARTLSNAAASRAPAKLPKATAKIKSKTPTEKSRKDFSTDVAWREYLFDKHKI